MVNINKDVALSNDSLNKLMQQYLAVAQRIVDAPAGYSVEAQEIQLRRAEIYTSMAMVAARAMR